MGVEIRLPRAWSNFGRHRPPPALAGAAARRYAPVTQPVAAGAGGTGSVQHGILRAATIIMLGNVLSRLVGYVRDIAIATIYGDKSSVSGYLTALKVQTSVYDLLISGVISAAFIPVFS